MQSLCKYLYASVPLWALFVVDLKTARLNICHLPTDLSKLHLCDCGLNFTIVRLKIIQIVMETAADNIHNATKCDAYF